MSSNHFLLILIINLHFFVQFKPALNFKRKAQNCSARQAFANIWKLTLVQKVRPGLEMVCNC